MKKYRIETNPAFAYAFLITVGLVSNWAFDVEGNMLLVVCGLGFFNVIHILDKILKKIK